MDKNLNDAYARIDAELSVDEKRVPFKITLAACLLGGAGIWAAIIAAIL